MFPSLSRKRRGLLLISLYFSIDALSGGEYVKKFHSKRPKMGLYSFVLFAAIVLLACVGSASKVAAANSTAQGRGDAEEQNGASTKSFARTSESTDEGDEARGLLNEASISHMLESQKVQLKAMLEKADTSILEKLEIGDNLLSYLESPRAQFVLKFLSEQSEAHRNSHKFLLGMLMEKYGELNLAQTLYTATHSDFQHTKTIATFLLEQQYQFWLDSKKSVEDIFALIKKGQQNYEVFASKNCKVLEGFIDAYNKHNVPVTVLDVYVKNFGDEITLLKALVNARDHSLPLNNVLSLQTSLQMKWVSEKVHPTIVLQWLEMDQNVEVIASSALDIAAKYVDHFNEKNPKKEFSLIRALVAFHGDNAVMDMLIKSKGTIGINRLSTHLRTELLQKWLSGEVSVTDAFKKMLLKEDEDQKIMSEKVNVLRQYIGMVQKKSPAEVLPSVPAIISSGYSDTSTFVKIIAKLVDFKYDDTYLKDAFPLWHLHYKPKQIKTILNYAYPAKEKEVDHIVDQYKVYVRANEEKDTSRHAMHQMKPRRT